MAASVIDRKMKLLRLKRERFEEKICELEIKVQQIRAEERDLGALKSFNLEQLLRKKKGLPLQTYEEWSMEELRRDEEYRKGMEGR